jgi:ABC-type antimicrobial peptide transport system permease subunit
VNAHPAETCSTISGIAQDSRMDLRFFYIFVDSLRVVWRFRFRSALILLSAMLGIAGVIVSVNFAAGGRQEALKQIERMGVNVLAITPQQDRSVGGRARTGAIMQTLVEADYAAIRRQLSSLVRSSALAASEFRLKAGDLSKTAPVVGCEPSYSQITNWPLAAGNFFDEADQRRAARVAVLGFNVARDLFGDESPLGKHFTVNRTPFEVVGVLTERGQGLGVAAEDDQIYVPLRTAMHRLMNVEYYSGLLLEMDRPDRTDEAATTVADILRQRHHRLANLPDDFQIQNEKALVETQLASSNRLGFYVRWIGLSGLFVSALGILAVCWIAVKGRTVEIGTRRALGANQRDVFLQILLEATVICSAGCALGLAIGWQGSHLLAQRTNLPFVFDSANARVAIAVSVAMNFTFALLPAARAAKVSPIAALTYE